MIRAKSLWVSAVLGGALLSDGAWPQAFAEERRVAIFLKGFGSVSLIGSPQSTFQATATKALTDHESRFFGEGHDRERCLKAFQQADILYYSGHATKLDGMQALQVKPSPANKNRTPGGNSCVTAQEIRDALNGLKGPTLVIMNGCALTDTGDMIEESKRISSAFGITASTTGRAFIGWNYDIVGKEQDKLFEVFLAQWTTPGGNRYPTLAEVHAKMTWGNVKPPVILGDKNITYRGAAAK